MQAFERSASVGFKGFIKLLVVHVVPHIAADHPVPTEPSYEELTEIAVFHITWPGAYDHVGMISQLIGAVCKVMNR
ncbi:hypothetical protein SBC1_53030 (plasmid) [Caballeronia sp. SBC1]|jgi:hypothetical protein|uniref:hypothetical protein n=1 Tax=unclassified Caballeronia TaxID=2646786 RepID=UPI0013E1EB1B|nr:MULTISPECIES: hypothetical protein [unclassified Caballeronia]QIE27263.1 hypothetical protein SBC2_53330 [Caballeronia sp. SBC2]QIN65258.1 hypothetical protein SBC1_53030 [Caballeronia sp. SBC1]